MKKNKLYPNLIQLIPREVFSKLARKWEVDKNVRTLSTYKLVDILLKSILYKLPSSLREAGGDF